MNLAEITFNEFEKLIKYEIEQNGVLLNTDIRYMLTSLIIDGNANETLQFLGQHNLSDSLFYSEQLNFISTKQFEKFEWQALKKMIENDANNKLAIIVWLAGKIEYLKEIEYPDIKLAEFYKEILFNYPNLITIDDILFGTPMFCVQPLNFQWELIIYEPILIDAIVKNPQKFGIHAYLLKLYYENKKYKHAMQLINTIVSAASFNFNSNFGYPDYLEVLQYKAAILNKIDQPELALKACNSIINNVPPLYSDENQRPFYELYIWTLLIRASINLERQNETEVRNDVELILKYNTADLYEAYYPEHKKLLNYLSNFKAGVGKA